ncbi:glycosyl transferase family protein [Leptolyngbya boryana NIES-2135]|uniref:Glycosyl transferase family protein n=1 Tax=Leptolyngbya boryana NIES-2135 TaxID=1973484 RepID=A0A1Z4JQY4_LEPBY|nr:glycosyltransferase [Leptolyngbya boryana]MBD2368176.1 glycosyltransferase [Leptolyngbya sp. FACHB-161]MBD2374787.1 glycosyltransferase [Leptolyngbya sp. FACHB-238]MBD2399209.1 glycosyltransferase [Leptolyngbya sp. FACHB-239]MBD2405214.1 glycosyltransferase [Leptolyngbya sp. FACHB-402]BAY59077.1 glycosyl transferase family protein [Leptolyngbya boryana NIES-2135]
MFLSVVIPTYNRKPILEKCLRAMERQTFADYEIVVVDDGSTDGTVEWLQSHAAEFPHVRLFCQNHGGAAGARNYGVEQAKGDTIVFIDSDLVVTDVFLQSHVETLIQGQKELGHDRLFTYGRVINTANFDDPTSEPYKLTDFSAAYFATGNVAIARHWLIEAGLFDTGFKQYGWEDLELGVRLKNLRLKLIKCPEAVGYHWHPAFSLDQIPRLIDVEFQRGRMGVVFYQKHPTFDVKMMIQMTWIHRVLWGVLSIGGLLNEKTLTPVMRSLIQQGKPQLAEQVARIFLNWYNVKAVYAAYAQSQK